MSKILMCPPKYFEVSYDINPWMTNQIGKVNYNLANEQWNLLYQELKKYTNVEIIDPQPGLPDMVFTANAGTILDNRVVLSKFAKIERQGEETHFAQWFYNQGYIINQPDQLYEGEGDHLVDNQHRHWMGCGFRTEKIVSNTIEKFLQSNINSLELVDNRWYHLDTAFCPLPNGELLWYPPAFSTNSQIIISQAFDKKIAINLKDALLFACNCVCIDQYLFMPAGTEVAFILKDLKYHVHEFDFSEFIKAGGAAKCLVLKLCR